MSQTTLFDNFFILFYKLIIVFINDGFMRNKFIVNQNTLGVSTTNYCIHILHLIFFGKITHY